MNNMKTYSDEEQDALRAQITGIMAAEGLTQRAVSDEADVPYGTLTPWLKKTYGGNGSNVAAKLARWIISRAERVTLSATLLREPEFVETPTTREVIEALSYAKTAPAIVLITLAPGMGKTATARHYEKTTPHAHRVVLRPSTSAVHSMLREIAVTLGLTERDPGKLARTIGDKLRRNGRHTLLMIDEAQNLSENGFNELRYYLDEYGCGIALLGNEDVHTRWGRSTPKEGYGQIHRRIGPRVRHLRPRMEDIDTYLDAWGITDPAIIKIARVIGMKPGALGQICESLKMAGMIAAGHGRAITADDLRAAWSNRGGEVVQ